MERAVRDVDAGSLLKSLSALGGSPADVLRDEAKVRSIASGLAWLATMTVDKLDQADPLLAEAWAWLALERSRDAGGEALAARALGYEAAAARAGSKLAADDPIRLYATGDEVRLGALCAGRPADRPCHFLRLTLLADREQGARFHAAILASPFKGETSLAALGLETRSSDYQEDGVPGRSLAALAFLEATGSRETGAVMSLPDNDKATTEARTRDFEAAVDRLAAGLGAGLLDSAAVRSGYRAAFYSGLFQEAGYAVRLLASANAAEEIAATFATPAPGTAEELKRWLEVKGQVLGGSRDPRPVAELLASAKSIGAAPLFDLAITIAQQAGGTDPMLRQPIPALFARLDTRPSHLVMAARVARRDLTSPWAFERFARAAAEAAPHLSEELPALAAEMREDAVRLREIAGDPAMPAYAHVVALAALAEYKEDPPAGRHDRTRARSRGERPGAGPRRAPENASETSGLIARARWQLNDFSTAAKELAASRNGIVGPWNRYLPEAFAASFATAPEESVRQAFSELQAAGIAPHVLADVAVGLGKKRGLAIALPLLEGLHDPAPEWRDYIRLATHDLILEKSGKDAALAWVKATMSDRPDGFALALYQMRKYDLLLGLYPEGEESAKPTLVRLLKAASLLHLRETSGPRWDGVVAEIAKETGDEFFVRAGRYFVGRIDAAEFLRIPPEADAGSLASVGWVMGVKTASERRFADADGWFQVALESGLQQQPPHAWSYVIESDWQKVDRSLSVLEKKGEF
jgi:hypothetical protein